MPAIGDWSVELNKLDDTSRTYAVNPQRGLTIDRIDNWRDEESIYHYPFDYDLDGDSSDGDYCLSRWTGCAEFRIREDCVPATQWTGERF
eukprot:5486319-Pyramimonas_sp.AAC.1